MAARTHDRHYRERDPRSSDYEPIAAGDLPKAPHNTLPDEESARRVQNARNRFELRNVAPNVPETVVAIAPVPTAIREPFTRIDIDWKAMAACTSNPAVVAYIAKHGIPRSSDSLRNSIAMTEVWARRAEQLRKEGSR